MKIDCRVITLTKESPYYRQDAERVWNLGEVKSVRIGKIFKPLGGLRTIIKDVVEDIENEHLRNDTIYDYCVDHYGVGVPEDNVLSFWEDLPWEEVLLLEVKG